MNQRENFYAMYNGTGPEFVPQSKDVLATFVLATGAADQPWQGGKDPFGVNWIATKEGCIPEPNKFMFEDISDWKKYVHFPKIEDLHLEKWAQIELPKADREKKVQTLLSVCGLFERMAAFMGFENTLMALVEDPESCDEFLSAFTDYKIEVFNACYELYHPDLYILFDDIATARGMFMSVETWREIFKPHYRKLLKAVTDKGVIYGQHTCGRCEDVIPEYVDMGVRYWHTAQTTNDIAGICERYGNKLLVDGGWDSQGPASYIGASAEVCIEETKKAWSRYGRYQNFLFTPLLMNEKGNSVIVGDDRLPVIAKTWDELCHR